MFQIIDVRLGKTEKFDFKRGRTVSDDKVWKERVLERDKHLVQKLLEHLNDLTLYKF